MSNDVDIEALLENSFNNFSNGKGSSNGNRASSEKGGAEEEKRSSNDRGEKSDSGKENGSSSRDRDRDRYSSRDSKSSDRDKDYYRDRDYRSRDRDSRDYRDSRDRRDERDYRDSRDSRDYHSRDRDSRDYRDRRDDRGGYYSSSRDRYDDRRGRGGSGKYESSRGGYDRPYERRPPPEAPPALPELTPEEEEESDLRTAFIQNISPKISESDLYDFFSKAGDVIKVSLITDRITKKLKGVGYVEFKHKDMVDVAVSMSGQSVLGHPIGVYRVQPEKKATSIVTNGNGSVVTVNGQGPNRIYVGFLHLSLTEEQIRSIFIPYGDLDFINIHIKPNLYKYAFVQFKNPDHAAAALNQINGKEVMGKNLKVTFVTEYDKAAKAAARPPPIPINPHLIHAGAQFQNQFNQIYHQPMGSLEEEDGSIPLSAQAKAALTAKLQGLPVPTPMVIPIVGGGGGLLGAMPATMVGVMAAPPPQFIPQVVPPEPTAPSTCLVLKNMFDPETESGDDWAVEIQRDVEEECSTFGNIKHIYLDKQSQGYIYMKYDTTDAAAFAISKLNRRWFSSKMLSAELIPEDVYNLKFNLK